MKGKDIKLIRSEWASQSNDRKYFGQRNLKSAKFYKLIIIRLYLVKRNFLLEKQGYEKSKE